MRIFFSALLFCVALAASGADVTREELVVKITDGDSVGLSGGEEIRLLGIDTPETKKRKVEAQPFANEARRVLRKMVYNKRVKLKLGVALIDGFNRTLARMYLPDGTDVQLEMLRRGLAVATAYPPDLDHLDEYFAAQAEAQRQRIGIWGDPYFATRDLDAGDTLPKRRGPVRVVGKVSEVKFFGKFVKIYISDRFTAYIPKVFWKQFWHGQDAENWIGKRVTVQGRISSKNDKKTIVRHPILLKIGE